MTPSDPHDDLPFVDEHRILVAAPAQAVWQSLARQFTGPRQGGGSILAGLLGTAPRRAAGQPLEQGATVPGFAVAEAVPARHLRLTGRHRFSRYALVFELVPQPDGTLLSARTDAQFPGLPGRLYRGLVIGTGGHRVIVMRLLRQVGRRAERAQRQPHP